MGGLAPLVDYIDSAIHWMRVLAIPITELACIAQTFRKVVLNPNFVIPTMKSLMITADNMHSYKYHTFKPPPLLMAKSPTLVATASKAYLIAFYLIPT